MSKCFCLLVTFSRGCFSCERIININYCVNSNSVDPNDQKKTACYDIDVEVDDTLKTQMNSFLLSTASQQEIAGLDNKVKQGSTATARFTVRFFTVCCFWQKCFSQPEVVSCKDRNCDSLHFNKTPSPLTNFPKCFVSFQHLLFKSGYFVPSALAAKVILNCRLVRKWAISTHFVIVLRAISYTHLLP